MNALIPDSVVFHPVAVNGTRGDTVATMSLEIQKETSSRFIWITAIAGDQAGGWLQDSIEKSQPHSRNRAVEKITGSGGYVGSETTYLHLKAYRCVILQSCGLKVL